VRRDGGEGGVVVMSVSCSADKNGAGCLSACRHHCSQVRPKGVRQDPFETDIMECTNEGGCAGLGFESRLNKQAQGHKRLPVEILCSALQTW
jgi:hypothetical protein